MSYVEDQLNKLDENRFRKSSVYKIAQENNVDSAILEGNQPDENAGLIKFKELDNSEKNIFLRDVVDFAKQLPKDTFIGLGKGVTNAAHILNNLTNVLGINPDDSYDFIQEKLNNQKQALSNMEEDSPLINKLISMLPQGTMYTVPIYNKLKSAGIPNSYAFPISAAIGETLAFDKTETFFVDSNFMRTVKESMDIPPDSSYEEVFDRVVQMGEYGAAGAVLEKLFKGVMAARKIDADQGQQGSIAVGGGAAAGVGATEIQEATESEEKKNPKNDDQSMIPGTVNEYGFEKTAGLVPVFKSVLKETAKNIPNKGSGQQILGQITNTPGVKASEIKWTGLDDFLKNKKSVTKEEVKQYLENNTLDVSEIQRPRRNTPAEDERELLLESKLGELDMNIEKYLKANPDALVTNELDKYTYKVRSLGNKFEEETVKNSAGLLRNLFDVNNLTEDDLLNKFLYKDKVVLHFLRNTKQDPSNLVGSKPYPVEEADRLLKQDGFERSSRYEFEPLEVRKYFTNKELMKFDERLRDSGTKFDTPEYTEPGGIDYTELIFKLKGDINYPIEQELLAGAIDGSTKKKVKSSFPYRSPNVHFGTKNEFAHVRFKTRTDGDLNVLTVEEMQSDIVQDMSKNFGERVTDFPFKNNWYELVTKRLIRYAADNNFDAVAIPKGKMIAERYGQRINEVTEINLDPRIGPSGDDLRFVVTYFGGGNKELKRQTLYNDEILQLQKELGPKNYLKIKDQVDEAINNLKSPEDLIKNRKLIIGKFDKPIQIGSGKGKVDLYDKSIPSFMRKYGKKWNARVLDTSIENMDVTLMVVTPEMKKSVQQDSQALFNIFGLAGAGGVGKAVLEDKGNNTISN